MPSPKNYVLLSGPRWSSKTVCALNAIAQHAWNTERGNICVLAITQSVGQDSGVWSNLTEVILPQWIEGRWGMDWIRESYLQGTTKKPTCIVRNRFGGSSRISLESLKNEDEVEARFKSRDYTMIFVNELSKFKKRKTFDTLIQCLRSMGKNEDEFLFLGDTNPAEEGVESFIYKLWYVLRNLTDEQIKTELGKLLEGSDFEDTEPGALIPIRDRLRLIEFTIDDNLALSQTRKAIIRGSFSHDPDLLARYWYGRWVTASAEAIFNKNFRPAIHVIPGAPQDADSREILWPEENCDELILGLDPGPTNFAAAIFEKVMRNVPRQVLKPDGSVVKEERLLPFFKWLDEQVIVGENFALTDAVLELVQKMETWERAAGKPGKIVWSQWSDRSVFDVKVPWIEKYWHECILDDSGGKIRLVAADRGPGSVLARVGLAKKLLGERRLFLSRLKCPNAIAMFKSLRRGTSQTQPVARSRHKHIFDAGTYALASECYDEMFELNNNKMTTSAAGIVAVPV